MNKDAMAVMAVIGGTAAIVLFLLSLPVLIWWYKASLQTAVYKRQGIEMTTWEVMWGAQPAERVIQVKDRP